MGTGINHGQSRQTFPEILGMIDGQNIDEDDEGDSTKDETEHALDQAPRRFTIRIPAAGSSKRANEAPEDVEQEENEMDEDEQDTRESDDSDESNEEGSELSGESDEEADSLEYMDDK